MGSKLIDIALSDLVLDNSIYPRLNVDHRRVALFVENLRDGFHFDPIEVEPHPLQEEKYRILDGFHRVQANKDIGNDRIAAKIIRLSGTDPLLYAASRAIGPRQLTEEDARNTARRAYEKNPQLTASEIGKAIGRSRQAVDRYVADLRAVVNEELELKILRLHRLGIPQERITRSLGISQQLISHHLQKMLTWAIFVNTELKKGFTAAQVAEKHAWPEPLVWSLALEGKDDLERFRSLNWGLQAWDVWNVNDCDHRFGDEWPGRIPAQLVAHILYFFSNPNNLVLDPMAGGGVVPDTCLAMGRRCWSFDMRDLGDILYSPCQA